MVESRADAFMFLQCLNHYKIRIEVIRPQVDHSDSSSHILTTTI